MDYLLQVDFPYNGPWGAEMTAAMRDLAESIANEPGLKWKIWTENKKLSTAGGIYLFSFYRRKQRTSLSDYAYRPS